MFYLGAITLLLSVLLHFQKRVDFAIQSLFYRSGHWLIHTDQDALYFFLYTIPRAIPWIVGLAVLAKLFALHRAGKSKANAYRALIFLGGLPLLTNSAKAVTGQACPNQFSDFAGALADETFYHAGARCFPGGHSSAGYALLGLCFLASRPQTRKMTAAIALIWGTVLATYQMARGLHFISDGFATLGIAFILYALLAKIPFEKKSFSETEGQIL